MPSVASELRKRREAFGFTSADVARLATVPEQRVVALEAGMALPTTSELAVIADALACNPAELALGRAEDPRRSVARFRAAVTRGVPSAYDLRLLARAAEAGRILGSLRSRLGQPPDAITKLRSPSAPSPAAEPWEHGYELGAAARKQLRNDNAPLASVQGLLEEVGIHVAQVDFESKKIEAASLFEIGAAPVVLLNRCAQRFKYQLARRAVLAHELCHLLHDGGARDMTVVSLDTDADPIEQRANGFAPSFIAPGEWVRIRAKRPKDMAQELGNAWGLSFEGASWHLKNLKRISPATAQALKDMPGKPRVDGDFERPLDRTPADQFAIDAEPSQLAGGLLSETAIIAAAEGVISRGRAAEILTFR